MGDHSNERKDDVIAEKEKVKADDDNAAVEENKNAEPQQNENSEKSECGCRSNKEEAKDSKKEWKKEEKKLKEENEKLSASLSELTDKYARMLAETGFQGTGRYLRRRLCRCSEGSAYR